jgi:hypothetical protein
MKRSRFTRVELVAARGEIEDALGPIVAEWPWSARLSRWIDALTILLEEQAA